MCVSASEAMVFGDGSSMSFSTLAAASTAVPAFGAKGMVSELWYLFNEDRI